MLSIQGLQPFVWFLWALAGGILLICVLWLVTPEIVRRRRYAKSSHHSQTGASYRAVASDKGRYGEHLTGEKLDTLPGHHRVLYNLYVPKPDSTTSEIDLVFLHPSGVYVVESKNYGGFIFGSPTDRQWTMTLAGGRRKEHFFNPLRQNAGHISALLGLLPQINPQSICSLVVFSERCELAKVPPSTWSTLIVKRQQLVRAFEPRLQVRLLSEEQIEWLFAWLCPLTQANETVRAEHIARVKSRRGDAG